MRTWCLAQQREKEERLAADKAADREYAAYVESLGIMRDGLEAEMKAERARQAAALKAANDRMVNFSQPLSTLCVYACCPCSVLVARSQLHKSSLVLFSAVAS